MRRQAGDHTLGQARRRPPGRNVPESVIDLHCHVLAGIDDGPTTIEGSVALARAALAAGTRTIVATPHVSWKYRNDANTIVRLVAEANVAFAAAGLPVEVVAGAEIAITRVPDLAPEELSVLALGEGPWLLIECPFSSVAVGLDTMLLDLQDEGHRIVLAHPERCPAFHRDPRMLEALVDAGVLTSITAGALVGRFGGTVQRFALGLVEGELVHNVASDAHSADQRRPGMAAELDQAGFSPLADWLTSAVPAAILAGRDTIPSRPAVVLANSEPSRRPWWRRRSLLRRAS
jgi:protein-tyrosine phosphatase